MTGIFLNRVCTDILAFEGDEKIHHSSGSYDYYLEKKQRDFSPVAAYEPPSKTTAAETPIKNRQTTQAFFQGKPGAGRDGSQNSWRGRRNCTH